MTTRRFTLRFLTGVLCCLGTASSAEQEHTLREGGLTGTGIVGTVTELGSFYINGHRIVYADDMSLHSPLGKKRASDIRPGNTVAVQVIPEDGNWRATQIVEMVPIIGPISRQEGSQLTVMGTQIDGSAVTNRAFDVGQWVAVSGLWRETQVIASALVPLPQQQNASIMGGYIPDAQGATFRVGGTSITDLAPLHLEPDDLIRVQGSPTAAGMSANTLDVGLFGTDVGIILAQGYLSEPDAEGRYTVFGTGIVSYTESPEMIDTETPTLTCSSGNTSATSERQDTTEKILDLLGC